ncbi:hypothetical protein BDR26DRAFT_935000 [Obelidium mucronatum]|nr:hypothetical protein BDR26DRAFT_935000 [Obelidium mucronatum]
MESGAIQCSHLADNFDNQLLHHTEQYKKASQVYDQLIIKQKSAFDLLAVQRKRVAEAKHKISKTTSVDTPNLHRQMESKYSHHATVIAISEMKRKGCEVGSTIGLNHVSRQEPDVEQASFAGIYSVDLEYLVAVDELAALEMKLKEIRREIAMKAHELVQLKHGLESCKRAIKLARSKALRVEQEKPEAMQTETSVVDKNTILKRELSDSEESNTLKIPRIVN